MTKQPKVFDVVCPNWHQQLLEKSDRETTFIIFFKLKNQIEHAKNRLTKLIVIEKIIDIYV